MSIARDTPYTSCNFLVDIGTGSTEGPQSAVAEVVFPDARLQAVVGTLSTDTSSGYTGSSQGGAGGRRDPRATPGRLADAVGDAAESAWALGTSLIDQVTDVITDPPNDTAEAAEVADRFINTVTGTVFSRAQPRGGFYRDGNSKENSARQVAPLSVYSPLILKRYLRGYLDWYRWWDEVRNGGVQATRTVTVQLLSEDMSVVVMTWKFLRARPTALRHTNLHGLAGHPLMEVLELTFDRLEME